MGTGVAYPLWRRIEDERLSQGWTKTQLAERSGLPRSTYNDLAQTSRPPLPRIVHAFADAVGIKREEAEQLAGLRRATGDQAPSVRQAIEASDLLTDDHKQTLIDLYDHLASINDARVGRRSPARDTRSGEDRPAI